MRKSANLPTVASRKTVNDDDNDDDDNDDDDDDLYNGGMNNMEYN